MPTPMQEKRVRLGLAYSKTLAKRAAELLAGVGQPHQWTGGRREAYEAANGQGQQNDDLAPCA